MRNSSINITPNTILYETIQSCRLCGCKKLEKIIDLTDQPPANSLRQAHERPSDLIPLQLSYCVSCSVAQLTATVSPQNLFCDYVWVTGTSKAAREYSSFFAENVFKRSGLERPRVIEIASNDGTFLKRFQDEQCFVLGVDPAVSIANDATAQGIPTIPNFFSDQVAHKIVREHGKFDVAIARNVIPHVKEVLSIIRGLSQTINKAGTVVIEFHYAKKIIEELHYDSIYHEHLFYFSLKSISKLFADHNLFPYDVFESPISGGSLVLFFSKSKKEKSRALIEYEISEEKSGLNELEIWRNFAKRSILHARSLKKLVSDLSIDDKIIGYGASARSSTLLNFANIDNRKIDYIIDKNPLKHKKLTPGTDIPIISYELGLSMAKGRTILLLAWNFKAEILSELRSSGFNGKIIVPLPNEVKIYEIH